MQSFCLRWILLKTYWITMICRMKSFWWLCLSHILFQHPSFYPCSFLAINFPISPMPSAHLSLCLCKTFFFSLLSIFLDLYIYLYLSMSLCFSLSSLSSLLCTVHCRTITDWISCISLYLIHYAVLANNDHFQLLLS